MKEQINPFKSMQMNRSRGDRMYGTALLDAMDIQQSKSPDNDLADCATTEITLQNTAYIVGQQFKTSIEEGWAVSADHCIYNASVTVTGGIQLEGMVFDGAPVGMRAECVLQVNPDSSKKLQCISSDLESGDVIKKISVIGRVPTATRGTIELYDAQALATENVDYETIDMAALRNKSYMPLIRVGQDIATNTTQELVVPVTSESRITWQSRDNEHIVNPEVVISDTQGVLELVTTTQHFIPSLEPTRIFTHQLDIQTP
ncbi:hypothetical protein KAZ66_00720 [Candidatus Woesebacteria bacterium]|nr:hypothetical protein [Candidatus Woesebacteria bacterium]